MPKLISMFNQSGLRWLWITLSVFALDQYTKSLALTHIDPFRPMEVIPFFNLVLRYNTGAAFSFLADQPGWQVAFFSGISIAVSVGLLIWLARLPMNKRWLGIALTLILAGAFGNLYDRLTLGKVVDFIDLYFNEYHWPAFNVADSAIFLGAVMLLLDGVFKSEKTGEPQGE